MSNPKAPFQLHRQKPSSVGLDRAQFQTLLPVLEVWAQQFHLLKVNSIHPHAIVLLDFLNIFVYILQSLQKGLNKLSVSLMPFQTADGGHSAAEAVKVEDMALLVDTILENIATDDEKVDRVIVFLLYCALDIVILF